MPPTQILTVTLNPALDVEFEVERMVKESKLRTSVPSFEPGGGGINVARAAHRIGAPVTALWVGGGPTGDKLRMLLHGEGIGDIHIPTVGEVRMSIHIEERATTDMYRFVLPGAQLSTGEAEAVCHAVATSDAEYVVLSGSMPPGAPADFYAQLAARASKRARVVLDTSGEPLQRGLTQDIFLAKPNKNELGRLLDRTLATVDDVIAGAREMIASHGVQALAVSMAEEGLVLVTRDSAEHVHAPKVEMVGAVGAGDSTVAGITVGLSRGMSLRDAARLGVACGTAAVLTGGSELLRAADVERLLPQVR